MKATILATKSLRSQHTLLVGVLIAVLSAVYSLAAYELITPLVSSISFTTKEIKGLHNYELAANLYMDLHRNRQPESSIGRIQPTAEKKPEASWRKIIEKLHQTPSVSFAAMAQDLRELIRDIGDESNLILDPEISSYYAADLLLNDAPIFVEYFTKNIGKPTDASADIATNIDKTNHAIEEICRHNHAECPQLFAEFATFKTNVMAVELDRLSADTSAKLTKNIEDIAGTTVRILNFFLNERLRTLTYQRDRLASIIVGLYVVLISLIVFSLRNYASKREINLARQTQQLAVDLVQKNDELEKFAYAAAHDLKEPVRTMSCYATLLSDEAGGRLNEAHQGYIGVIERMAKRAERMINDLLEYTRVAENKLMPERCDTAKEVDAVLEDLNNFIDKVQPIITVSGLPIVETVPSMFRRVMTNLIDNAMKYRKPNVPLTIAIQAKSEGDGWIFSVTDNGIGIADQHIDAVFEPFRRLYPALYQDGQGIGLTSCKKIVERLGGKIWILSELNIGTVMYFSLPQNFNSK